MDARIVLRHYLATLRYRATKAITDASDRFPAFEAGNGARKPIEILSHITALLSWAQTVIGGQTDNAGKPGSWQEEVLRFQNELGKLDQLFKDQDIPEETVLKLVQGPLADAMTHVGQLAMLRRLAEEPITPENYFVADIQIPG
jgi:hypothetical protein